MNGQVTAKFEYVRFDGENIRECAKFAGDKWFHNNPKFDEKQFYGIKLPSKETVMLCTGDYLVKDYFGHIKIESIRTFFQQYTVIAKQQTFIDSSFEKSTWPSSTPLSKEDKALFDKPKAPFIPHTRTMEESELSIQIMMGEHPMHELGAKIRKQIQDEERKHLSPDTITNLIQSNLERNPDGYSMDALSRTMLGRGDRGQ